MSCLLEISSLAAPEFCYTSHKSTTLWTCFREIRVKDFKTHCDIWGGEERGFVFLHLAYDALLMGAWRTKESGRPHICAQVHKEAMFINKCINLFFERCTLALWKHKSFLKSFATVEAWVLTKGSRQSMLSLFAAAHLLARSVMSSAISTALPNFPPCMYWANTIMALWAEHTALNLLLVSYKLIV